MIGITLALIQFVVIAYICVIEAKRKASVVFMWATLMVMFGVMHAYSVITNSGSYSSVTMNEASLFVTIFCIIYLVTRNWLVKRVKDMPRAFSYDELAAEPIQETRYMFVLFILAIFWTVGNIAAFSGGILNATWGKGRDYTASLGYVNSNQLSNLIYFSMSGLSLYFLIKKQWSKVAVAIVLMLLITLVTTNRILVIPILVVVIAYCLFRIKKIKITHAILAGLAAVGVIYLVYGLRVYRHIGSMSDFIASFNIKEFIGRINHYIATDNGELGLRNDFYFFLENDNQFEGFGKGATYLRMLLVYIPTRFAFGLKPSDFAITMGAAVGMAAGGSTHPTLFGDCYANLGWFGILLGAFWAGYATLADHINLKFKGGAHRVLVYCLFATMYVIMGRGSVYNSFFYVAWGLPILVILIGIQKKLVPIIQKRWSQIRARLKNYFLRKRR